MERSMRLGKAITTFGILLCSLQASATGYRSPAHSVTSYNFTCPSGASGHVAYTQDFVTKRTTQLTIWVNGRYVQDDPLVSPVVKATNVEQIQAECEGDNTLVVLKLFRNYAPEGKQLSTVSIHVDPHGKATVAGS
jgi:hypothetical protein